MSEENVEIVRQFFDRFGTSDAWREHVAEDVVWDASAVDFAGVTGIYHGHAGVEQFFRNWLGPWDNPTVELMEIRDAGESVFTGFRWRGRGRTSGVEVERDFYGVYDFRDGLLVGFRQRATREKALEAAGLSE
jgi:ketosteroid isomerase-like protein